MADANCLLTVGRVMRAGGVVYRDIYEQKGPTLYLLHALAACVSDSGFLGVYLMETLSLTAALFAAYRFFRLRAGGAWSLGGAAVWGAIVLISPSFCKGDSAEEFCLPLLMAAMAVAYAEYGQTRQTDALCMAGVLRLDGRDDFYNQVYPAGRDAGALSVRGRACASGRRSEAGV